MRLLNTCGPPECECSWAFASELARAGPLPRVKPICAQLRVSYVELLRRGPEGISTKKVVSVDDIRRRCLGRKCDSCEARRWRA